MTTLLVQLVILSPAIAVVATCIAINVVEEIKLRRQIRELKRRLETMPLSDITAILDEHGIKYTVKTP